MSDGSRITYRTLYHETKIDIVHWLEKHCYNQYTLKWEYPEGSYCFLEARITFLNQEAEIFFILTWFDNIEKCIV